MVIPVDKIDRSYAEKLRANDAKITNQEEKRFIQETRDEADKPVKFITLDANAQRKYYQLLFGSPTLWEGRAAIGKSTGKGSSGDESGDEGEGVPD